MWEEVVVVGCAAAAGWQHSTSQLGAAHCTVVTRWPCRRKEKSWLWHRAAARQEAAQVAVTRWPMATSGVEQRQDVHSSNTAPSTDHGTCCPQPGHLQPVIVTKHALFLLQLFMQTVVKVNLLIFFLILPNLLSAQIGSPAKWFCVIWWYKEKVEVWYGSLQLYGSMQVYQQHNHIAPCFRALLCHYRVAEK